MLIKPNDWTSQYDGGYCTDWFKAQSPMCGLRFLKREQRDWILNTLESAQSAPVRAAMNKAQSTPYRVNKQVLNVLREAVGTRLGILGLPSSQPRPQPVFPFPEGWLKEHATVSEMEQFKLWKDQMRVWYTNEAKRAGRKAGILSRLRELVRYQDEEALYFPTFIDWRGRMYFRSILNPQSNDAVKGCLEFAEGKPLGTEGLFWLKVLHVCSRMFLMVLVTSPLSLDLTKVLLQVVNLPHRLAVNLGLMLIVKILIIALLAIDNNLGARV